MRARRDTQKGTQWNRTNICERCADWVWQHDGWDVIVELLALPLDLPTPGTAAAIVLLGEDPPEPR